METLDDLTHAAAALDIETTEPVYGVPTAGEGGAPPPTSGEELTAALTLVVVLLTPAAPWLPTIYTDAVLKRLGDAGGAVCDKYGWSIGDIFGRWGEELNLLAILIPLVMQTVTAVRASRRKPEPPQAEPEHAGIEASPA